MARAMESPMASWKPSLAPLPEEEGLFVVGRWYMCGPLVMDGGEVVGVDLDAHLYAEVVDVIDVPCGGVADDLAIARLDELGALPEGVGERGEAEGGVEALAVACHGFAGGEVSGVEGVGGGIEGGGEGGSGCGVGGGDLLFEGGFEVVHLEGGELGVGGGDDVVDVAHSWAHMLPRRWAGIMPSGRSAAAPYFWMSLKRT